MGNNLESIIFRVGWDARDVDAGMKKLMAERARLERVKQADHQKLVTSYRQQEKEQAESARRIRGQEDQEQARRNIQSRKIRRERVREREAGIKEEGAAALRAEIEQARRNNLARKLWRDRAKRREEGHEANSGALSEAVTLARELSRGNLSRVPGSASILLQRMGWLGKIFNFAKSPFVSGPAAGVGGFLAGRSAVTAMGDAARETLMSSRHAGFSSGGYQGLMQQSKIDANGPEAMQGGLSNLHGNVMAAANGSVEAFQKFKMWGVAIADVNGKLLTGDQIYRNAIARLEQITDTSRRAAMGTAMFGENYYKMERTLGQGTAGFDAAQKGYTNSTRRLTILSEAGDFYGRASRATGGFFSATGRRIAGGYAQLLGMLNPNLGRIGTETQRGEELDAQLAKYRKPLSGAAFDAKLRQFNPELFETRLGLQHAKRDTEESFEDRLKPGLGSMADLGRSFTGQPHRRLYGMTPRLKTALRIQDMEEQAQVALMKGDDSTYMRLNSETAQLRSANPWLAGADKNVLRQQTESLASINRKMTKVEEMAAIAVEHNR